MISKELLSEVLDCNCTEIINIIDNELLYEAFGQSYINIYELAYKCKEWAFDNGFGLMSGLLNHSKTKIAVLENIDLWMPKISFIANTEYEAILKACEWILNNKANE